MAPERRIPAPQRTCVQCGTKGDKGGFYRIAGRPGKGWEPDPEAKMPGRGIYLCRDAACIAGFARRIRTQKGAARWKMGASAGSLAIRLEAWRDGS
ncbi:MAG TPA: YlxR family protein [Candidatus Deferrimicrobiaceae bacterium]|nr:YlxR family protein [Candidatus Deferrimicrobiaceae bacterium]